MKQTSSKGSNNQNHCDRVPTIYQNIFFGTKQISQRSIHQYSINTQIPEVPLNVVQYYINSICGKCFPEFAHPKSAPFSAHSLDNDV